MDNKLIEQFEKTRGILISSDVSDKVMTKIARERPGPRRGLLITALAGVLSAIIMAVLLFTPRQPIAPKDAGQDRIVVITGYPHPRPLYPNPAVTIEVTKLMKGGIKP